MRETSLKGYTILALILVNILTGQCAIAPNIANTSTVLPKATLIPVSANAT